MACFLFNIFGTVSPFYKYLTRLISFFVLLIASCVMFNVDFMLVVFSVDCVRCRHIVKTEGFFGLFRGISPTVIGVAPHK